VPDHEDQVFISLEKTELGPMLKKLENSETRRKIDLAIGT
jgi:hypothetical protein